MNFPIKKIESMIYTIRNQKVMLDSDLAKLYGVETKVLNQAVKRNLNRFPLDFMLVCNSDELNVLRSQIVTANDSNTWNHKRRTPPMIFTENGIAMLSSVLTSEAAIEINIAIMRTFTKLRSFLVMENSIEDRVDHLESDAQETQALFRVVFEKLDRLEHQLTPKLSPQRKKIGLK